MEKIGQLGLEPDNTLHISKGSKGALKRRIRRFRPLGQVSSTATKNRHGKKGRVQSPTMTTKMNPEEGTVRSRATTYGERWNGSTEIGQMRGRISAQKELQTREKKRNGWRGEEICIGGTMKSTIEPWVWRSKSRRIKYHKIIKMNYDLFNFN